MKTRIAGSIDLALGGRGVTPLAVKVPFQITLLFWVTKIVSTAMGEALADWLDGSADVAVAALGALVALVAFVVALRGQFRATRYRASVYWFTVAMVATFGTMAADALHQFLGAPYWATTLFYAIVLGLVFWRWLANEGTLSIHSIDTRRREKFYWGTVFSTFALGTATGDWTAGELRLNFLPSGVLFTGLILLTALAYRLGANSVATFWIAYVLTRPLGASFADYLDHNARAHGAGLPTPVVWGALAVVMVGLVCWLARTERDRTGGAYSPPTALSRPSSLSDDRAPVWPSRPGIAARPGRLKRNACRHRPATHRTRRTPPPPRSHAALRLCR